MFPKPNSVTPNSGTSPTAYPQFQHSLKHPPAKPSSTPWPSLSKHCHHNTQANPMFICHCPTPIPLQRGFPSFCFQFYPLEPHWLVTPWPQGYNMLSPAPASGPVTGLPHFQAHSVHWLPLPVPMLPCLCLCQCPLAPHTGIGPGLPRAGVFQGLGLCPMNPLGRGAGPVYWARGHCRGALTMSFGCVV